MESIINIQHLKEDKLDFDLVIQGLNYTDIRAQFIIETGPMEIGFSCFKSPEDVNGTLWNVIIPPLPQLDKTTYNFHISVVVDGYYFEPYRGAVNVIGTHQIYATVPKVSLPPTITTQPVVNNELPPIVKNDEPVISVEPELPPVDIKLPSFKFPLSPANTNIPPIEEPKTIGIEIEPVDMDTKVKKEIPSFFPTIAALTDKKPEKDDFEEIPFNLSKFDINDEDEENDEENEEVTDDESSAISEIAKKIMKETIPVVENQNINTELDNKVKNILTNKSSKDRKTGNVSFKKKEIITK